MLFILFRNVQNANPDSQLDSLDMPVILEPADVNLNLEVKETGGGGPPTPAEVSYVNLPCGLFPQALGRNTKASQLSRIKAKFRFLGKFMAKAVMDSRMVRWSPVTLQILYHLQSSILVSINTESS